MRICSPEQPLKLAVLISGNGSNLQALIDAIADGLPAEICVVISNQAEAYGLERAKRADIPVEILPQTEYLDKQAYDEQLAQCLEAYHVELIVLAGFMRILTPAFIQRFQNRILNIHPSLLPKYTGLNTHARALAAKDDVHGATVHVVTAQLDQGPIIMQAVVDISPGDDVHILQHKVHAVEHKIYPEVIQLYSQGRLELTDKAVWLDGEQLPSEGLKFGRLHY